MDSGHLEKICQSIYFPTEPIKPGAVALMHAWMFLLIRDYVRHGDSLTEQFDCQAYIELSHDALATCLAKYDTIAIPTFENMQALIIGV